MNRVMLEIPDSLYQRLQHFAQLTGRPLENLMLQALTANLPPLPEDLPSEMQAELAALEPLSDEALRETAGSVLSDQHQNRYNHLLEKQRDDALTQSERDELEALFQQNEKCMLRKAYAYALLKWRGHRLPPLSKLSKVIQ